MKNKSRGCENVGIYDSIENLARKYCILSNTLKALLRPYFHNECLGLLRRWLYSRTITTSLVGEVLQRILQSMLVE